MALKTGLLLVILVVALTPKQSPISGLELGNFDPTVRPQDDLYRAVNGEWIAKTPMPTESGDVRHVPRARRQN